jgi:phage N-6-adenine-methyltransferase
MVHERHDNTTAKDEQRTPPSLFKKLDDQFHFNKDIACTIHNHLCPVWYDDFLHPPVSLYDGDRAFCNPPYSHGRVEAFLSKGYTESLKGAIVVFLIPCDISTHWFDWCMLAAEWIRIKGRVHFNHADGTPIKGSPSFSSIVVVFDEKRRKENGHLIVSSMDWK